jgi:ABC-type ATPase with predicted acetyltransferase domain
MFGLTKDRLAEKSFSISCQLQINSGEVVYITGPSGAGKSVLLRELEKEVPASERINLAEIELAEKQSLIDCFEGDILEGLKLLSDLSDGQKYRFRLAKALDSGRKYIFGDEFCSNLDRITAAVISYNVRKFAKRRGVTFILAGTHDDILGDLCPDVLVVKELSGPAEVIYKKGLIDA